MSQSPKKIWRVIEVLQWGEGYFLGKGIEQPRLEIDHLVAHVLRKKRLEIYLMFDAVITTENLQNLKACIERRISGEPLQYILGETDFFGCRIKVNPSVLIPRSETEHMVDEASRSLSTSGNKTVLDLGTGSGAIAIALAKLAEGIRVRAVDSSPEALEVAKENALINGVSERIEFVQGDMIEFLSKSPPSELIVSNPPYIPLSEYEQLSPSVKNYEPRSALTDEEDGIHYLREIIKRLPEKLTGEGEAFLEFGFGLGERVFGEVEKTGLKGKIYQDLARHARFIRVSR